MGFCRRESSSDASGSKSSTSKKSAPNSSSSGEESSSARSKSRSKSKGRSAGSSSSKSRSSSRSRSRSPSPRRPSSRSPTKSSPASGNGGKSETNKSVKSDASCRSNGSGKAKKLLKASERKASAKMEKRMSNEDSDSEDESNLVKESVKDEKVSKKKIDEASEPTWRDEFDDGLDDEFRGNEEDMKSLAIMTEKEREEEIFKRAEKREELKKRFEISQKLKLQLKDNPVMKQKSDGELSSDDDKQELEQAGRKKGYEVKHATKFSALSQLKAKREEKVKKDQERKSKEEKDGKKKREDSGSDSDDMRRLAKPGSNKRFKASETYTSSSDSGNGERRKSSSSSSSSSSSASSSGSSGESDTERHKSKKVVKKAINVTCKEDLEKIRLSRFKLDKFVHLPIFKRTVVGCFVRVSIGNNPEKNMPIYRVAEITDVCETAKVYDVMKSRTNIGLRLNHGKMSKVFRAQFISNQPFTESEFSKWKQTCLAEHVDLPTVKHVEEKLKGIQTALTYRFSSHDVDKILASKEKFAKGPKNYAMAKAKMMKDKVNAQIDGNTELVEEIDCKLAELEERAEKLDKARTGSLSNISFINDRNRKNNVERAERGIREEQKRLKMEGKVDDPFTRRKTRPVLSMPRKEESREMTSELLFELENERKVKEEKILSVKVEKEIPDIKKRMEDTDDSDIFNVHDFDIDIKIGGSESGLALNSIAVKPVTTSQSASASNAPKKRSLKLEDYKRRRGII